MKITKENIDNIKYIEGYDLDHGKQLLKALLEDVDELNNLLIDKGEKYREVFINYEDKHTEYSPERIDPCPDFYGMFTLRFEKNPYETIGNEMLIKDLDEALCILINFTEFKLS